MGQHEVRQAVLLDEHPLWLDAVEALLRGIEIEVAGKARDADAGIELVSKLQPSLFVAEIDTGVADSNGVTLVRRARAACSGVRTIVLSQRDDPEVISAALAAGATAYVVKTAHPDDLAAAVRQAFGQSVYFASGAVQDSRPIPPLDVPLTTREREILALVAEGRSNAQLAKGLWVTEQTVKFHLSNIYRKLGVSNRTEASRWAQLHGLVSDPGEHRHPNGTMDAVAR